ncbi:hypothetical protein P280DRAFT_526441 [Massarina eburnea CBS 473.64]|uniref:Asl1-like glycosyl hydrolase catalytic domain-containing protein n=1 Tax=Massarina eburnea CBS 473.64 TaxID=1395130 RepID=A0A6A6RYB4_9PLEO|nr:hypothetical protein P280DRAFT_526441 [Massarina eburnea CBS 473.64]
MLYITIAATATLLPLTTAATYPTSPKRGLCYVPSDKTPNDDTIWTTTPGSNLTWYYNYKSSPSPAFTNTTHLQFVPMFWGTSDSDQGTPFLDSVKAQIAAGAPIRYVMGFNEPDGTHATGGSNVPADLAAAAWKKQMEPLRELGVMLGAPAVTGGAEGFAWLENWLRACDGGCHPDFLPVHWYGSFEGFASHLGQVVEAFPHLPVWVTEWGFAGQGLVGSQGFFNESVALLDRWGNITHYAYFGAFRSDVSNVGPNAAMLTEHGKLTDIGSWYLGGAATNNGGSVGWIWFVGWWYW